MHCDEGNVNIAANYALRVCNKLQLDIVTKELTSYSDENFNAEMKYKLNNNL